MDLANTPVVIMAGGKGSRLSPITDARPKALVELNGCPIIDTLIQNFAQENIKEFYLILNHLHKMTIDHFEAQTRSNIKTKFIIEDSPLGTIGGLTLIKDEIACPFFVSNCDVLVSAHYKNIYLYHQNMENELTVVTSTITYPIPYGVLETDENMKVKAFKEKPHLPFSVSIGLYILSPHLISQIPQNKFYHITDLIQQILSRNGNIGSYNIPSEDWIDIGLNHDMDRNYKESREIISMIS